MASSSITSWQIHREKVEIVADFIFLGSKITVDSHCSHKIKRRLLLGRIAMTNLDSILKSRDITLLTKLRFLQQSCVDVRVGPQRMLKAKELMLSYCGASEDSSESLGQQGDQTSQS